ncbi:MAG: CHAT domain-containing protein [Pseudonocardia sp.]
MLTSRPDVPPGGLGMPPAIMDGVMRVAAHRRSGDRRREAMARFELGGHLVQRDRYEMGADELAGAGELFVELGMAGEAATALFNAGVALCIAGRQSDALPRFAAAEAALDQVGPSGELDELRWRLQAVWLDALEDVLSQDRTDATATAVISRCDRLLALIGPTVSRPDMASARRTANYQRARLLTLREEYVAALPSAREVAEQAERDVGKEPRAIERQMRSTIGAALAELGKHDEAAEQFVRLVRLSLVDGEVTGVELAVLGLQRMFRREQGRLADVLGHLPDEAAAAGDVPCEARLRFAYARALEMTPRKSDLGYSLRVVDEYVRAADLSAELGEIGRDADARYSAGHLLSTAVLVHPEHRERVLTLLEGGEKRFRHIANWHGVGICLFGQAELLNRWYEDVERDDDRIERLMAEMVEVFRRAERPMEEASAWLMWAVNSALHSDTPGRFLDQCLTAFEANERGRAVRLLPSDREFHDRSTKTMLTLLAAHVWDHLTTTPDDPRRSALVWGFEQIVKGRSLSDQLVAPDVWRRFMARDPRLRQSTEVVERAQFLLEEAVRGRNVPAVEEARTALEAARLAQRRRLQDVTDDDEVELSLASVPPATWEQVQELLAPGEMFIGLVACGRDRFLRTQLTPDDARFDTVEAPELMFLLSRQRFGEKLRGAERRLIHRRALDLLAPTPVDNHQLIICPDRDLVAVPWHLLAHDGRPRLGDRVAMSVVPAAGTLAQLRRTAAPASTPVRQQYLGVAEVDGGDREIENIRNLYFRDTGHCLPTGRGLELLDQRGHVGLLHITSHAFGPGFQFTGGRVVTPIDLTDMALTADILLLTGCHLGSFQHDDGNEFFGIVRQLLVATGARAALVARDWVIEDSPQIFSDLVVSALTARAPNRPWAAPPSPMNVAEAVRWARLQMRELNVDDARQLLHLGSDEVPDRRPGPARDSWWSPWFVLGDPSCRLPADQ